MPTLTDKQRAALATLMSDDAIVGRLTLDDVVGALYALTGDAIGAYIDRGLSVVVTLDVVVVARVLRTVLGDEAPRSHVEGFGYLTDAERASLEREDRTEDEIDFAMTGDYGGRPTVAADERDPVEVKLERDAAAERHRAEALAAKGAPGVVADPVRPAAPVSDPVMEHMRSCGARRGLPCDCADWEHPER